MGLLSTVKGFIYSFDLLSSSTFLRIKGSSEYTTIIGGISSITLIILLVTLFYNKIIGTFNKDIISSSTLASHANNPLPFNLTTADRTFMLGIQLWNVDLTSGQRYFDVSLDSSLYRFGAWNSSISYALQPCTVDHWQGYPEIQSVYTQLRMQYWLCFPKNVSFDLYGKLTSPQSKSVDITISQCSSFSYDTRPCASAADVSQLFTDLGLMYYTIYFINPLINPDSPEYLSYYLQDKNYITFSDTIGEQSRLFIQDYEIDTDQSILPIQSQKVETGGLVSDVALKSIMPNTGVYGRFSLYKSPYSLLFTRSFQKLDDVFSYIGGLFGIVLLAFFLVSSYNSCKYEINLAGYLYHSDNKIEKKYTFLYYLCQVVYEILGIIRITPNWQIIKKYNNIGEEVVKQLDILLILKRINFIEKSLSYLFTDHQLKGLHLSSHYTLEEAVRLRKSYQLKPKLKEEMMRSKNKGNASENMLEQFENLNDSIIIGNKPFVKDNQQENNKKEEDLRQLNFDSDRYSSQSSSSSSDEDDNDKGQISLMDSIKLLKSQSHNPVSKRIWNSIDPRFNDIMKTSKPERTNMTREDIFEYTNANFQEIGNIGGTEMNAYVSSNSKLKDSNVELKEKSKRTNQYGKFLEFESIEVQEFFEPHKQK